MDRNFEMNICESILGTICNAYEYKVNLDALYKTGLQKEFFSNTTHRKIFEVLHYLYKTNKPYTEDILLDNIIKMKIENFENVWINIISKSTLQTEIAIEYIAILKTKYHRDMLQKLCLDTLNELQDESKNPEILSQKIRNGLDDFNFINNKSHSQSIAEVRKERKSKNGEEIPREKTGIPFIDTVLTDKDGNKGFRNEGLIFISGMKESGKTFILTRIIENISKRKKVHFGSLEFGKELYDEEIEEAEKDGLWDGNIENIIVFDDIYDIDEMVNEIRFRHKEHDFGLIAIDSMMRISNNKNPELKTDEKKLSDVFSKFGKLSKEIKVPIIIITQTSKEDAKASMISVKGAVNADHEAYIWFHLTKTFPKNPDDEQRFVIWNKNKDTKKHPIQYLMFEPDSKDFYRIEVDKDRKPLSAIDKPRKSSKGLAIPQYSKKPVITEYEEDIVVDIGEIEF